MRAGLTARTKIQTPSVWGHPRSVATILNSKWWHRSLPVFLKSARRLVTYLRVHAAKSEKNVFSQQVRAPIVTWLRLEEIPQIFRSITVQPKSNGTCTILSTMRSRPPEVVWAIDRNIKAASLKPHQDLCGLAHRKACTVILSPPAGSSEHFS